MASEYARDVGRNREMDPHILRHNMDMDTLNMIADKRTAATPSNSATGSGSGGRKGSRSRRKVNTGTNATRSTGRRAKHTSRSRTRSRGRANTEQ
ncbi:hypothetical protein VTN00DRAFT_3334 [Thermoascus crustaceus]|uniref:uncharacterized protein n=1 Tax=Thermoascus crustaceus TaxID=5088 RepID=UPI0037449619